MESQKRELGPSTRVETCLRRTRAPCGGEEGEIEEEELKDAEGGC
jgi:hypothetical protein